MNMSVQPDVKVFDASGDFVLAVEIKNKWGTDVEWALKLRRNMAAHGLISTPRYFLLALPDRFYLWRDNAYPDLELPEYEIDPLPLFKPYVGSTDEYLQNLSGEGFELLVVAWLSELLQTSELPENEETSWLIESGLFEAIQRGHMVSEVMV